MDTKIHRERSKTESVERDVCLNRQIADGGEMNGRKKSPLKKIREKFCSSG